ncbi:hypothetical protein [Terribacillus saccharophilus]|uniref:hypothetical protein n=1 Tax=Terribacillus saccharophilus TaxID=361277 RepID=UPI003982D19F
MKLFIEYILDEIEQIGTKHGFRVSLSSCRNDQNYLRGTMQFFDSSFHIHYLIIFTHPEENPNLNYTFWLLNSYGNERLVEKDGSKEKKVELIKDLALKEIPINLARSELILHLFSEITLSVSSHDTPKNP